MDIKTSLKMYLVISILNNKPSSIINSKNRNKNNNPETIFNFQRTREWQV